MPIKNEENASHMTDSCVIESLADNFYMSYTQNELADSSKSFLSRKSQLSKLQNRGYTLSSSIDRFILFYFFLFFQICFIINFIAKRYTLRISVSVEFFFLNIKLTKK